MGVVEVDWEVGRMAEVEQTDGLQKVLGYRHHDGLLAAYHRDGWRPILNVGHAID